MVLADVLLEESIGIQIRILWDIAESTQLLRGSLCKLAAQKHSCVITRYINIELTKCSSKEDPANSVASLVLTTSNLQLLCPVVFPLKCYSHRSRVLLQRQLEAKKELLNGSIWNDLIDHVPNYL
jgi:hypothetical protein